MFLLVKELDTALFLRPTLFAMRFTCGKSGTIPQPFGELPDMVIIISLSSELLLVPRRSLICANLRAGMVP